MTSDSVLCSIIDDTRNNGEGLQVDMASLRKDSRRLSRSGLMFGLIGSISAWLMTSAVIEAQENLSPIHGQTLDLGPQTLDGLEFIAGIVRDDETNSNALEDRLIFNGGTFSSVVCERYNFAPAPYWIRQDGPRTHFLAELSSPTDGTMVWTGVIENGRLEGTMRWTRTRWYWTVDAEHRIKGTVATTDPDAASD